MMSASVVMMLRVRMMSLLLMSLKFNPLTLRNDDKKLAVQAFYGCAKGAVKRAKREATKVTNHTNDHECSGPFVKIRVIRDLRGFSSNCAPVKLRTLTR